MLIAEKKKTRAPAAAEAARKVERNQVSFYWKNKGAEEEEEGSPSCDDQQKDRVMKDGRQTGISHTRISVPDISLSSLYRRYCSLVRYVGGPTPKKIPFKTHVFTYYFRYIVLTADFQTREHNRSLLNTM